MDLVNVRAVRETDDFDAIYNLVNDTSQRFSGDTEVVVGSSGTEFKKIYSDPSSPDQGFIYEEGNNIVAFMGISPSSMTKNGYIEVGFLDGCEHRLSDLLLECIPVVQNNGGTKIFKFTFTKFGQVRNKEITLWEKLGFISDEYSLITTQLDLRTWKEPDEFDATGIEPALTMDYEDIKQMLTEDGEDEMAELFQNQYSPVHNHDQVVLTLKDKNTGDIAGIAYYRMNNGEFLNVAGFGVHIRPQFALPRDEITRFVQGCLVSMKQLDCVHVITRITLKNFNTFSSMIAEGFHNEGLENANVMRLCRSV